MERQNEIPRMMRGMMIKVELITKRSPLKFKMKEEASLHAERHY